MNYAQAFSVNSLLIKCRFGVNDGDFCAVGTSESVEIFDHVRVIYFHTKYSNAALSVILRKKKSFVST